VFILHPLKGTFIKWWQGDQIGRIFSQYFRPLGDGLLWAVYRKLHKQSTFFYGKGYTYIYFDKYELDNILGDYFTSSFGNPEWWCFTVIKILGQLMLFFTIKCES
jgi:hypothetical protein